MKTGLNGKLGVFLALAVMLSGFTSCALITGETQSTQSINSQGIPTITNSSPDSGMRFAFGMVKVYFFKAPDVISGTKTTIIDYKKDWVLHCDADWLDISLKEGKASQQYEVRLTLKENTPDKPGIYKTEIRLNSKDGSSYKAIGDTRQHSDNRLRGEINRLRQREGKNRYIDKRRGHT
jgi:hypothetical protein